MRIGNVATIIGVNVMLRITDDPKVTPNAMMMGVPVITTTFQERWSAVMMRTVNATDQGKIIIRSS